MKSITCPSCEFRVRDQICVVVRAVQKYSLRMGRFVGGAYFLARWHDVDAVYNNGEFLAYECSKCGELYPNYMFEEIRQHIELRKIKSRLESAVK